MTVELVIPNLVRSNAETPHRPATRSRLEPTHLEPTKLKPAPQTRTANPNREPTNLEPAPRTQHLERTNREPLTKPTRRSPEPPNLRTTSYAYKPRS